MRKLPLIVNADQNKSRRDKPGFQIQLSSRQPYFRVVEAERFPPYKVCNTKYLNFVQKLTRSPHPNEELLVSIEAWKERYLGKRRIVR